jgi:hypothetical protein
MKVRISSISRHSAYKCQDYNYARDGSTTWECTHVEVVRTYFYYYRLRLTSTIPNSTNMANRNVNEVETNDEEKALLPEEPYDAGTYERPPLNMKLWLSVGVNTLATIAIVRRPDQHNAKY